MHVWKCHDETPYDVQFNIHQFKRISESISDKNYICERRVEQRYWKLQKKESNRNPGNKKSLYSNKKHCGRSL
jgi:hypothetical protein